VESSTDGRRGLNRRKKEGTEALPRDEIQKVGTFGESREFLVGPGCRTGPRAQFECVSQSKPLSSLLKNGDWLRPIHENLLKFGVSQGACPPFSTGCESWQRPNGSESD